MKKFLAILLTLCLCTAVLAGCGGKSGDKGTPSGNEGGTTVAGETYDAGNVQVLVPKGWMAIPQVDVFAEEEGATDPDVISVCKDAKSDFDLLSKPFVRIDYYGPDTEMMGGLEDWYEDVQELDPIVCGPYTWTGFTTTDYGLMAILIAEDGAHQYQASIYLETEGGTISLEDEDVLAILASVKPSANAE